MAHTDTEKHTHHITPLWVYFAIGGALLFLTVITVLASFVPFSEFTGIGSLNFVVAMLIATTKATLVALFFMHLLHDNKFYLLSLISAVMCLMIFIVITMFDTQNRGMLNPEEAGPIIEQVPNESFQAPKAHKAGDDHH